VVIALVWEFDVRRGKREAFEKFYGADGAWTALSRRSRSFLGSSFLRDQNASTRYLLVEYWSEMVIYEKHQADFTDELKQINETRDAFCTSIKPLGLFTGLDVPDRWGPTWSRRDGV
jgi:quinol monooxygenase YgiN